MDIALICLAVAVVLFLAVFVTGRRFGLLGFALAAGSLLSTAWIGKSGWILGMLNAPSGPLIVAGVSAVIIVLPALLLMFHDGKYKTFFGRAVGAVLFMLLALAFLVEPIGRALIPTGVSATIFNLIVTNQNTIIVVCLVLATIDLLMPKRNKSHEKHQSH